MGRQEMPLEVIIDPSRRAEKEYLRGILIQKSFEMMKKLFENPKEADALLQKSLDDVQKNQNMDPKNKELLAEFLGHLKSFMGGVDQKFYSQGSPFQEPKMRFTYLERDRKQPISAYEITFPQAVLWGLIGCAAGFAISLVSERTHGTFLRLRTAPLSSSHILAGKALACFMACLVEMVILLGLGKLLFRVRLESPLLLLMAMFCAALCFVGIMMLVSALGKTEKSVAGAGWAILLLMAMTGGAMIPLMFMPGWFQTVSHLSPVKWSILALEGAIWRGFTFQEMLFSCGILLCIGAVFYLVGLFLFSRQG
jgi:ABC-2 type transport system permease protein